MTTELAAANTSPGVLRTFLLHKTTLLQLGLAVAIAYIYQIESDTFLEIISISAAGFLLSIFVDRAYRLQFFVLLSLFGICFVLGVIDGAYLIALGLVLIGIANLPLSVTQRALLLLVVGAAFAYFRTGAWTVPWSEAVWPILGSMFMFRMILYLRAIRSGNQEKGLWNTLAYFFMLPNVAFPLFPVIDYQGFKKNYFDRDDAEIYEQGMLWISRGIVHLTIYRFVYHNVLNDPRDVVQLSDLVQSMLGTFLLYLRVSGQFHIIVGILHLFGFRLPETHKLYYLAHGFTELWRRINIYWTEFMMNLVFYPAYFKVKKLGPKLAVALATAMVFVVTWLLHSYQWFWLRGGFPIHVQDILFWGILGSLVILGALRELRGPKSRRKPTEKWSASSGLRAALTFSVFCFLWSLWSSDSFGQWLWMLGAATSIDGKGLFWLGAVFFTIMFLGGWDWERIQASASGAAYAKSLHAVRVTAPLLLLLMIAIPAVNNGLTATTNIDFGTLLTTRLNAQDAAARHRGYYEQLDIRQRLTTPQAGAIEELRRNWKDPAEAGIINERSDILSRDLYPNVDIIWNGNRFSTNEFGMRDQSYSQEKPKRTLRIALLGPSHVMGNGVGDGQTFESLLEEQLNKIRPVAGVEAIEILNFGVDGFALPQQYAILVDRVFDFDPDLVLLTQYHQGSTMTETYLSKILKSRAAVDNEDLREILEDAGLAPLQYGDVPVPFPSWRRAAEALGISTRMPSAELTGRIHQIVDDVNDWAITAIAEETAHRNIQTVVVVLNEVLDAVPDFIPNAEAISAAQLPVINLLDVYSDYAPEELRVAPWDEHPNETGHRLIADRLYIELIPHLESLAETRSGSRANDGQ